MPSVEGADSASQAPGDRSRAQDEDLVAGRDAFRDRLDEPAKVLETVWLTRGLRPPPAAVSDGGIVADVTGRAVTRRNVRRDPVDARPARDQSYEERPSSVDPDQAVRPVVLVHGGGRVGLDGQERAHTGPSSSAARSA